MNINNIKTTLKDILENIDNKNFEKALSILNNSSNIKEDQNLTNKLFSIIYFKKKDWKKSIEFYHKRIPFEDNKYGILNNIGVALFNLGKITESINTFKKSINENSKCDLAYDNLGLSYKEIGFYEKSLDCFVNALKINKNNVSAKENLLSIFNVIKPQNINLHPIIECNIRISKIIKNNKSEKNNSNKEIKKFLSEAENIISSYDMGFDIKETQIFRKNSVNLNCDRHFKIFNEFKIIPKYCFNCYKVQIELNNVVDLIKLFFLFDNIDLKNNNIRKCIVETRANVKSNYKGYIYCDGLSEAKDIFKITTKYISKLDLINHKIFIKHGCSEYAEAYPKYKEINLNNEKQKMEYDNSWMKKEKIVDDRIIVRKSDDEKKFSETLKGINLHDIVIIKNWLNYAKIIGDNSYKEIYEKNINNNFLNNLLINQLDFRRKELLN